ncbi:hypothetical protein SAMN02745248_01972 [Hathewaya proteolytica DSM 3090]|uniref:Peptidase propeptide and YPEB domain-containing protein n=1 Tax=Hathewaya proteolytica DSM 3090 TaxID=1121331 RepID=A0A1M6QCU4_9CLOT|nr:hypothetical protein [Hathewaya proteolytica]SHK17996.1 hypothetical protein SAMN02745248_01972 [Hathewaya proteolytica DSM 3090]
MHIKKTFIIGSMLLVFAAFTSFTACSNGQSNDNVISNEKIQDNIDNSNKKDEIKYNKPRSEINADMSVDLDNNEEIKKIACQLFYKYYGLKIPSDKTSKFEINRIVDHGISIINLSFMGAIDEEDHYLSMVINKDKKLMERIDATNYNKAEREEKIDSSKAEKIAEEYLLLVEKDKFHEVGTIKIVENTRDGYKIIFMKKDHEEDAISVSVNPYTAEVTSFLTHWINE